MHTRWIIAVVFVAFAASTACATVQNQGFSVGSTTDIGVAGGPGVAGNLTTVAANNNQFANSDSEGIMTFQMENGALFQGGTAGGAYSIIGTTQDGQVVGQQAQYSGNNGLLGSQSQSLNSGFLQNLVKIGGIGAALGMQGYVGGQIQIIASPFHVDANVKNIGINQYKSIGGGPTNPVNSAGSVVSIQNQHLGF